jgi:hypothetical protein
MPALVSKWPILILVRAAPVVAVEREVEGRKSKVERDWPHRALVSTFDLEPLTHEDTATWHGDRESRSAI